MSYSQQKLDVLLKEIGACRVCADILPHGPRPVIRASTTACILIVGQAPGRRVHESGIPWDDPSGDRLRRWMDVSKEVFYDETHIAIVPMGFCYPGTNPKGGDFPPRPECAQTWHTRVLELLPNIELTLLFGQYAQAYFLGDRKMKTLTETTLAWQDYAPEFLPMPHPSPLNMRWLKRNPWFEIDVVPELQRRVRELLPVNDGAP